MDRQLKNELAKVFAERIASGLKRKSITSASRWAETYRVMRDGKWSFNRYPWLKGMHDSKAEMNVGQKAAQMGFTETVLNLTFYKIDVENVDCLYVLPSKTPDASDFSAARFDPALELSPHLSKLFSDVKNVGHKRAGTANLYIRGSQSRSGLKSIPVGFIVLDEVAEMVEENIPLALERASGQRTWQAWMISTPTVEGVGISPYWDQSSKEHFYFKCPSCSKLIELRFPDSMILTGDHLGDPKVSQSKYCCYECKQVLPHETKPQWLSTGIWVPEHSDREEIRGFSVNQMYSSAARCRPDKIAEAYFKAQSNPADETEFFNSKLGLTHAVDGARVSDEDIANCIKAGPKHRNTDRAPGGLITMGVDVGGKILHYEIDQWFLPQQMSSNDVNIEAKCKVVRQGRASEFSELDALMQQYSVIMCVIDANPEKRSALEFCRRFWGRAKMSYYGRGIYGKTINQSKDLSEPAIVVDRTAWLDMSLSRFRTQTIFLPIDTTQEYKDHIKALTRVYEKDKDGNPTGRYVKGEHIPDHFAHARNYAEMALPFVAAMGKNQNLGKIL